jgi:AcrR family transcriptional regulator
VSRRADDYGKRGEQTRQRILDATFRLIGREQGLGVRIEQICVAAPISRAAFYHYFTGLEDLLAALSLAISQDFNRAVLASLLRMDSYAERTDAGIRYYLEKAVRDPVWGWAMVHISANGPLFGADTLAATFVTISEGIAAGEFDIEDAQFGCDMLQGTVLAAMITQLKGKAPAGQAAMVSRHILRGLGVSPAHIPAIVGRVLPDLQVAVGGSNGTAIRSA